MNPTTQTPPLGSDPLIWNSYDAATGWLDGTCGADGTAVAYTRRNGGGISAVTSVAGTVSYSFDVAGRRSGISSQAGTFGFSYCDWNGRLAAVTNSHGLVTEYQYDIMDRVTNIAWRTAGGASLGGFAYEYDALGRIVSRDHVIGTNAFDRAYAYDCLDCLASDGDTEYSYDAAGNRMSKSDNDETITYTLGVGDRLASWTGGAYTYDTAGNVTQIVRTGRPTLDLTWNSQYQLVSVATNGVFAEGYTYDALGRRVSTTTQEGTIRHVYDDNWQCIADLDEQDNVVVTYVWGEEIDRLLAVKVSGAVYYPLTDIQGTIWGYVDVANNVVAQWQYDAWGNIISKSVSIPSLERLRYRFQCREWSAATGLINFRMRWYDAETGRWISKDPIGVRGGLNVYLFCLNAPTTARDPYGLVDLNYFPPDETIYQQADKYNPDGVISIGAHGDENGMQYANGDKIDLDSLGEAIRNLQKFKDNPDYPIQIDSCDVGKGQFPQLLADKLNRKVLAPNQKVWYLTNWFGLNVSVIYAGMKGPGQPDYSEPGRLLVFMPRR